MDDKRKNFIWRYQPFLDSDKATMLNYIDNQELHPAYDKTELMLRAVIPYYMPLALYLEGNCSREKLESLLADSAIAFTTQLKYLCAVLNVEPTRMVSILYGAFQMPNSFSSQPLSSNAGTDEELDEIDELDDFDPQAWNVSGITTDSETFEFMN